MTTPSRRIAWIGLGVMGAPMAGHLLDAGHDVVVFTRSREKADALLARGVRWARTPREAADGVDVAFSMLGFPADVEAVHLGADGTLSAATPPRTIVDMTTSAPGLAVRLFEAARERGVGGVDAPVSGGDIGAREARLSIMVGGEAGEVDGVRELLDVLGRQIVHHGGPGMGQHAKMVNQILVAAGMIGAVEGLLYADRAGLDAGKVIESVSSGAAGSWAISNLGPRMIGRDFEPGFYVEHFVKDLGIALGEARHLGLDLPGLELARSLYEDLAERGYDRAGTQALLLELEARNPAAASR